MSAKQKPQKPRPDFPLFAHAAGVWAKKIDGTLEYFGPWDKPNEAEARYLARIKGGKSHTRSRARSKSKLPKGFPLTLRTDGRFCKQVKGKMHTLERTATTNCGNGTNSATALFRVHPRIAFQETVTFCNWPARRSSPTKPT